MTSKKLSEEAEQKVTSIKSTKARADVLSTIAYSYTMDIAAKYDPIKSELKSRIDGYKVPEQKSDVEAIILAIKKAIGKKYHLRHEVVCKIASGNDLTFVLDFNTDTVPALNDASKKIIEIGSEQKDVESRLATWKRKQLINIANGLDFEEFKI